MKYFIWILGCAMNYSDAERLAAVLNLAGHQRTENQKEADLFIVVSCSVRQSAINRIYGKVEELIKQKKKNPNFKTILTGCVLKEDRKKLAKVFDIMIEIKDINLLPDMLGSINSKLNNSGLIRNSKFENQKSGEYLNVAPEYSSPFRAYVPISTGCNNFCSYCAVPYTRGREKSRPIKEIVGEVSALIAQGYKEITLLGQNVNSYGSDFEQEDKNCFVELLKQIDQIPGEYRVYFYSNHPKDMSEELINLLPTLVHFPAYIHLPLQSGNNEIIKKMNRHYTKESYLKLVQKIKKAIPDVTLTTDVIVGFPGENEAAYQDTKKVMEDVGFDMAFTAMYSPRPGTRSAEWPDNVSKEEKIAREKELIAVLKESVAKNNKKLDGTIQKVLFDGAKGENLYARTEGYKVVEIRGVSKTDRERLIGQFGKVKIVETGPWKLIGELV